MPSRYTEVMPEQTTDEKSQHSNKSQYICAKIPNGAHKIKKRKGQDLNNEIQETQIWITKQPKHLELNEYQVKQNKDKNEVTDKKKTATRSQR